MGDLLPLDVSIHQRGTNAKETRGGFDVDWCHFDDLA
jgi:hypothetical protein